MPNPTTSSLITEGLGYCCPYFFFAYFSAVQVSLIAQRLGISGRTVHEHRRRFREGKTSCANCANCMKGKLK